MRKSVRLMKTGMKNTVAGELELYDDVVILRMLPNHVQLVAATIPPPTFLEDGIPERIEFAQIARIIGTPVRRLFSGKTEIELQMTSGDTWTIGANGSVFAALTSLYETWKKHH